MSERAAQLGSRNALRARLAMAGAIAGALLLWLRHGAAPPAPAHMPGMAEMEAGAKEHPDDPRAQLRWGVALVRRGQNAESVGFLEAARTMAPGDARPYAWLGVVAMASRRTGEARDLLNAALRRDPDNGTALRAMANLDASQRRLRPAIQGFERLTRLHPADSDAWQRLGLLLLGAGENYRSLDALSRAADLAPNDLMTESALGNLALQAGRLDVASRAYRKVLAGKPGDPQALTGLAKITLGTDPTPSGLASAEKQVALALQSGPALEGYKTRGEIRMAQRRFPEAMADFTTCTRINPEQGEAFVLLSQSCASAGRPDLARRASAQFERLRARRLARDRAGAEAPATR